jgi:hypothetical protein
MSEIARNTVDPIATGGPSNDYHLLPATEKQLQFARAIAQRSGQTLPWEAQQDRQALSTWIDENKVASKAGAFSNYASSKQVAFAERIARMKRRTLPDACIKDRGLMSKWIDHNR